MESHRELIDDISSSFESIEVFTSDKKLEGEYLLGFFCQRYWLKQYEPKKGEWKLKERLKKEQGDD